MKKHFIVFASTLLIIFACKETKREPEAVKETAIESSELERYGDKFKKLIVTEDGILRGFTFITDSSEIKRNENAQLLASNSDAISYTIEFNELEMADIIYHLKGNEVDTFEIDLYLRDKPSTDSMLTDFKKFYSEKHGNSTAQGDSLLVWKDSTKNVGINLKYINNKYDHGINVYIFQNDTNSKNVVQ